jgi:hypothetical protein
MKGHAEGALVGLRKSVFRRPSPAFAVAMVALLVALAAPGYAAFKSVLFAARAGNAQRVDGLRASRRPHPHMLLALGSHGKFPASVSTAGPPGARGVPGAPGSAIAYSTIVFEPPDGGGPAVWRIDDTLSKKLDNDVNLGDTGRPDPGVFCFHDLPFTVSNVVASPGPYGGGTPFLVQAETARPGQTIGAPCPPNTTVAIDVTNTAGVLENPPDGSDKISFELN